ncbi:uncharacterized protein LOC120991287 [Bufo bufo]|uniref:uncharacterized protein LOC120991287 n=1 Tax=Bufo bufo TaxID=8384 RepID=UPI001ABDED7B|nr:uncharacterized protein LOC120991287 [Bufo bufo]XP_040276064.1 uncharacterized protein LOC120991287 [Bufo bufo]
MSAVDLNDGDTTESFVDLSESDETVQEKEQLLQECQTEQVQMNSEQEPDPSQDITCDYKTEGSPRNEGLAYREEKPSQEPKEPGKDTGYQETQETSTKDRHENSPEEDYSNSVPYTPGEMLGPQEDAEYDNGMPGEANQETQTGGDSYGSPQETPSGGSQDEAVEEHNATLSNKPEPHVSQDDKGGSMACKKFKEGNFQETTSQKESGAVHTEEAMEDLQEVNAKKELHDNQTDEGIDEESLDRKDTSPDDHLEEQKMTMHERDQEQTGRTRDNMSDCTCEEQPVEPLQLKTEGSDWLPSLWTSKVNGVVTLRMEKSGPAAMSPVTVPQFFSDMVKKHGQKVALYARMANEWKGVTYSQYEQQSRTMAKAFLKLGLERFHAVLILGSNSPEWFMADIAAMLAGGLAIGIDPLSNASFCLKVALDSRAQIVLVDDHNQLEKILKIKNKLPKLKAMVQWRGTSNGAVPWSVHLEPVTRSGLGGGRVVS